MHLIVITPEQSVEDEPAIVNELFEEGLQRLHLRKPGFTETDYKNYLADIGARFHSCIVIHNHFELYEKFGLGGIHLNNLARNNKKVWETIKQMRPDRISTSYHSWHEIIDNEFPYGYIFISPVFDSISKEGYKAGIDLNGANETRKKLTVENKFCPKIIGLGGVGPEQINILHERGFDGAAILGAIWLSDDPVKKFKEIMYAVKFWQ